MSLNCLRAGALRSAIAVSLLWLALQPGWAQTPPQPSGQIQPASAAPALSANVQNPSPSVASPLGGYDVLIADRGNNRILLVNAAKKILWQYDFPGLRPGSGADDAFFADGGKSVIVNLEHQQVIQIIDVADKSVTWQYGRLGARGASHGRLDYPDDAYQMPGGNVIVADIRNCRILEISPGKKIVRQAGVTDKCWGKWPSLPSPNGDKPLPDGGLLVSTINNHSLIRLDKDWKQVLRLKLPLRYPSDPQLTAAGNFIVADYSRPGKIIEIDPNGHVIWQFTAKGEGGLNHPSLAVELPNGNVLATDDLNHRVIVVDKATGKIVWQYGVTGRPGTGPDHLSIPDGLDIKKEN